MKKLFGTDGIRGIANSTLTASLSLSLGECFARMCREDTVYVGMDTRGSSTPLSLAVCTGISAAGKRAVHLGVLPTGALAYLSARHETPAIMISASHNPFVYNGIKFFDHRGRKLSDGDEERLEEMLLVKPGATSRRGGFGRIEDGETLAAEYLLFLKEHFTEPPLPYHAVIDCANGSAVRYARELFQNRFQKCTFLSVTPNGENINAACGSTAPAHMIRAVGELGADLGLSFDGDADRLIASDGFGEMIDGDRMLAFFAQSMKEGGTLSKNTAVGTVMSNFGLCRFLEGEGISFIAERVGDRYVAARLAEGGYSLGGEPSGHLLFPDRFPFGDGAFTALMLLSEMRKTGAHPCDITSLYKTYPQYTLNIDASPKEKRALLADAGIQSAIADFERGIREDGRLLVRPSGTEDLIRITVEAPEEHLARALAGKIAKAIQERIANTSCAELSDM